MRPSNISDICKRANISVEEVDIFLSLLKLSMKPFSKSIRVTENGATRYYVVERVGVGPLETEHGKFWQYSFCINDKWQEYSIVVKADIDPESFIPEFKNPNLLFLRIDSGCETGQLFGDLTCECGDQLSLAMKTLNEVGEGLIINIPRQDGRGMGLPFKLGTLWAQDVLKMNTVESAMLLSEGGVIDTRTYSGVVCILKFFGITNKSKIDLATNNPKKAGVFVENGYIVGGYTPIVIEPNKHTEVHLRAKEEHLGHRGLIKKQREINERN